MSRWSVLVTFGNDVKTYLLNVQGTSAKDVRHRLTLFNGRYITIHSVCKL